MNAPESKASRRGFLGVAAAGLAGVMLAPGVRLIEIAAAAAPQQGLKPDWNRIGHRGIRRSKQHRQGGRRA